MKIVRPRGPVSEGKPMPIYEFYCRDCHTVFSFFSRSVNTRKIPACPKCGRPLSRQVSLFAFTGKAGEKSAPEDLPIDENRMAQAMEHLAGEAETINEDDPRQAAGLIRRLSDMTGLKLGQGMQEALTRLEKGEDPQQIEAEMGDLLDPEDLFAFPEKRKPAPNERPAPAKDETLYDL